jgi:hypothetical protein
MVVKEAGGVAAAVARGTCAVVGMTYRLADSRATLVTEGALGV